MRPLLNGGTLGGRVKVRSNVGFLVARLAMAATAVSCSRNETPPPATSSPVATQGTGATVKAKFSDLSAADSAMLDKQRGVVAREIATRYEANLTKTKGDLVPLQKLLDDGAFKPTQTFELQSLGVVFGDVLAADAGLHWTMVTDEYGTDPTLIRGNSSLQVNTLTMISKRVERGEKVDVSDLFARAAESVRNVPADAR
jgi:hypothetical protein